MAAWTITALRACAAGLLLAVFAPQDAHAQSAPRCEAERGYASSFGGRGTYLWRPDWLVQTRLDLAPRAEARRAVIEQAQAALDRGPYTVVDKTRTPESGDVHDYASMAPYWWPNPDTIDGLPFVRRDGVINPERNSGRFDLSDLESMSSDVSALALAYYLTSDQRYATKAAELIRVWFLAPETRMNPNLNHAQGVPGVVSGRAEGVIDVHRLPRVIESVGLLAPSGALSEAEVEALRSWFGALVAWMLESPIGQAEQAKRNNHGVFFDLLVSHFALFSGRADIARATIGEAGVRRLDAQIAPDGSLPEELSRTRSLHYTTWTIAAMLQLAQLGQCVGVDLYTRQSGDGRSLRRAVEFVAQYAGREQEWPYPELDPDETAGLYEVFRRAAWAWSSEEYAQAAQRYAARQAASELNLLIPAYREHTR